MNTFLSSAQEAIRESYLSFASETVAPIAEKLERRELCLKEFLQELGQKGFLGISAPREYGGQGNPFTFCALFVEAVSRYEPGLGLSLANHYALIEVLKKYGSETQKSRYLPLLSRGEILGTLAFSEECAGTDYKAVQACIGKKADSLVLNGQKVWVVNGQITGLSLAFCKNMDGESDEFALVLVDCSDESGKHCSNDIARLGLRSAFANNVEFKAKKLGSDSLIKNSSDNTELIAGFAMDVSKLILAAAATGLLQGAMENAIEHARTREQFGLSIGKFQGVQWKLADMYTDCEGARLQVMRAAWSLEADPEKFPSYAAMSKWFASKVARHHSGEALQIMGAQGLSESSPLSRFYRDAKSMEICLGTSEGQKMQLVELLEI